MKSQRAADLEAALRKLTAGDATRLMQLAGAPQERRPVDDLLDRLSAPDSSAWFHAALKTNLLGGDPQLAERLLRGTAQGDEITALKQHVKHVAGSTNQREEWLTGVLCYFLLVAAGLAHDGVLRSSRDPQEMRECLLELATAVPSAWADLLTRACAGLR
jgi:hypothetical protein